MSRPHFKIIANEGLGHTAQILIVDGDNEIDISKLVSRAQIDCEAGRPIWIELTSPYAEIETIGYVPESRLREFVSLGRAAERMLKERP